MRLQAAMLTCFVMQRTGDEESRSGVLILESTFLEVLFDVAATSQPRSSSSSFLTT